MLTNVKKILVPVDNSEPARYALVQAIMIARYFQSSLKLISVTSETEASERFKLPEYDSARSARERLLKRYEEMVIHDHNFKDIETEHFIGDARKVIMDVIHDDDDIGLVVMGATGKKAVERLLIGSVAQYVTRHSPIPVLLARKNPAKIERILVPTDTSEVSERALEAAVEMAKKWDSQIDLLFVAEDFSYYSDSYDFSEVNATVKKEAEEYLASLKQKFNDQGVTIQTHIVGGDARLEITHFAKEQQVDLITMGASGKGGIERLLLGSVSEYTIMRTPINTLIIH
ncbi:MAG: universal stress protein [Aerococcus sp.]|nr:universal stress protein [Aerococcus sp.]